MFITIVHVAMREMRERLAHLMAASTSEGLTLSF